MLHCNESQNVTKMYSSFSFLKEKKEWVVHFCDILGLILHCADSNDSCCYYKLKSFKLQITNIPVFVLYVFTHESFLTFISTVLNLFICFLENYIIVNPKFKIIKNIIILNIAIATLFHVHVVLTLRYHTLLLFNHCDSKRF